MTARGPFLASLLAVAAPAWALPAEAIRDRVERIEDLIEAWDNDAARAEVQALADAAPDDPQVKYALARVRFEDGDYAGAVALFDAVDTQRTYARLARDTLGAMRGTETRESAHFQVRYRPGKDAALAPYALEGLERIHDAMAEDLGFRPRSKVRVEVVENARTLATVSTLTVEQIKTSGTIAICKFNKLMVTSPKALLRGYGWLDTLAHEYVHFAVSKRSHNTVPIWLQEGLAKYLESRWRGPPGEALSPSSGALLTAAVKKNKLIPFARMHPSMALLPSQEDAALAFAEVFTAIEFVHRRGGMKALNTLVDELKAGRGDEAAVAAAAGMPFARFTKEWQTSLERRKFPVEAAPAEVDKLRFAEDDPRTRAREADPKIEVHFGDFLDVEDKKARRFAHLGELLRVRGRPKAAVDEFARAYDREGSRSPSLANRYAQALHAAGSAERAQGVLSEALKPYPNYPTTHLNLARFHRAAGGYAEAERHALAVVGQDPFDPEPHAILLEAYQKRGDDRLAGRERNVLQILAGRSKAVGTGDATVRVSSHPYALLMLDGADTGLTTPATLTLKPGRHTVRLSNQERGIRRDVTFDVGPGEERELPVDFEAESAEGTR